MKKDVQMSSSKKVDEDKIKSSHLKLLVCIENKSFRSYLEHKFSKILKFEAIFIDKSSIANAIAENPKAILILQSEIEEYQLLEIAARLKRVFAGEIKIIFLSLEYNLHQEASTIVDKFVQFPVAIEELLSIADSIYSPQKKVLLIDDSKLVHRTIVADLIGAGFEVFQAYDGEEGYEKAIENLPGIIICDIEMPRMNGYETCKAIRKTQSLVDTHIIMSSTLGSAADQRRGFEVGVDEYITKPVVVSDLVNRINNVFNSSASGRENILLLSSEDSLSKGMVKSLVHQGFNAKIVKTIKSAIKSLSKVSCDLIISEIEPLDGSIIDLFNELRLLGKNNLPEVLIMTSRESDADAKMALNSGATGVVTKPFTMEGLLAVVERTLADRRSRKEKEQLARYVSKASMRVAIEKTILGPGEDKARADKKLASVFFSDIANFTARCERYTAKEIVEQINLLFEVITKVIIRNNGDIDKFIGDACMAFWLDEFTTSSSSAVLQSIIEMQREIEQMNHEHPLLRDDPITVRMGANTGEVILCDIGAAEARVDLTIIGDTVNAAARLESASKQYGVTNLISENTFFESGNQFAARLIDKVRVKGKSQPLVCYELLGLNENLSEPKKELKQRFDLGFLKYQNGNFDEAYDYFLEASKIEVGQDEATSPSKIYLTRCEKLMENPPSNWDGIWSLDEK